MSALVNAYHRPDAAKFLWQLMEESMDEPETTIAHKAMPSWEEHLAWLERRAYRVLLLIVDQVPDGEGTMNVGYVGVTEDNEIGIRIRKGCRGKRYGQEALNYLLEWMLPFADAGIAPGRFVANINPKNAPSIALFTGLGFTLYGATAEQLVYVSPIHQREETHHGESQTEGRSPA